MGLSWGRAVGSQPSRDTMMYTGAVLRIGGRFTFYVLRFTFYVLRFTLYVLRFTFYVLRFSFYVLRESGSLALIGLEATSVLDSAANRRLALACSYVKRKT
jgi:hypothetical protein